MNLGVLGGSGLYEMDVLEQEGWTAVDTPFGAPSDEVLKGRIGEVEIYFIPRHGRGHVIMPSEINHRANICALKQLGVRHTVSVSAVGSLREDMRPRDIVVPDQYFDRTKQALRHTFFGEGLVGHVPFGDPLCPNLRRLLVDTARDVITGDEAFRGQQVHDGGTYVNMEGPAFSTKAESDCYRKNGFDIIGMTSLPEAKLCREAGICYAPLAMVTDYDCWHETEEAVSVEVVIGHLQANVRLAQRILAELVKAFPLETDGCADIVRQSILTSPDAIPAERNALYRLLTS